MSQLIQIKEKIKAIESIKKITHAMRLISMSAHSQLKDSYEPFALYASEIEQLFSALSTKPIKSTQVKNKILIIFISSQKGLCGNFNTTLFSTFKKESLNFTRADYITIGKKAYEFISKISPNSILHNIPNLTIRNQGELSEEIIKIIQERFNNYDSIISFSNKFENFFTQKPTKSQIIPSQIESAHSIKKSSYLQAHSQENLNNHLTNFYLSSKIQALLLQSLFAEHAARFVSMDLATNNAKNMLDEMQLKYNKLRQTKITRELTELTASNLNR